MKRRGRASRIHLDVRLCDSLLQDQHSVSFRHPKTTMVTRVLPSDLRESAAPNCMRSSPASPVMVRGSLIVFNSGQGGQLWAEDDEMCIRSC
jgi:hypothetical protein